MSITYRLRRSAALCAIACVGLVPATAGTALADGESPPQERYYSSYKAPEAPTAEESYLSSYGDPEPLASPQSPVPSDGTPWLPIALSIAGTLILVSAGATQVRRLRIRRRRVAL